MDTINANHIKKTQSDDAYSKKLCSELALSRNLDDFKQRIHDKVRDLGCTDYVFMRLERA